MPPSPTTTIEVRNLKPIDFNLYVLAGTHRLRLGTVPGMTTRTLVIPPHLLRLETDRMRFGLDTIGAFALNTTGAFWPDIGTFAHDTTGAHRFDNQGAHRISTIGSDGRFISKEALTVRAGDQLFLTIQELDQLSPTIQPSVYRGPGEAAMDSSLIETIAAVDCSEESVR